MSLPVIAIFDIGKTNKKLLLFDQDYHIVYQEREQFAELQDKDGFPCEDLGRLSAWVQDRFAWLLGSERYTVRGVNFSGYGASFVHLGERGQPVAPLYNYLKPFPDALKHQFYDTYGGEERFSVETASPVLGHLNSGMQLYWLKHCQPDLFAHIEYSLHLPQYLSYLLTQKPCADLTSIGCHTGLWHFARNNYHRWVEAEGVYPKFAPIYRGGDVVKVKAGGRTIPVGVGLHDSSAALIPYLLHFREPFVLLSTGTWCIALNPFNEQPLSAEELHQDCLCYLTYSGAPVKASRLFAGHEHEQQAKRIALHFEVAADFYQHLDYDASLLATPGSSAAGTGLPSVSQLKQSDFAACNLNSFTSAAAAYHQLVADLVALQQAALQLVLQGSPVKRIFVDGGFSCNKVYMNLLAAAFPQLEVYAATMAQASALGAALVLHPHWNARSIPAHIIELDYYHLTPSNVLS